MKNNGLIKWNDRFFEDDFFGDMRKLMRVFEDDSTPSLFRKNRYLSNLGSTNVQENENEYKVEIQVPGFKKEDITLEVENNYLTISGKVENKKESDNYKLKEFNRETFYRSFTLPDNIDSDNINAECKDGILTLSIKKKEIVSNKKVLEIK